MAELPTVRRLVRALVAVHRAGWPLEAALAMLPGRTAPGGEDEMLAVTMSRADWRRLGAVLDPGESQPYPLRIEAVRLVNPGSGWSPAIVSLGHHEPHLFAAMAVAEIRAAKIRAETGKPCGCAGAVRPDVTAVTHEWWIPRIGYADEYLRGARPALHDDANESEPVTVYRLSPERAQQAAAALGLRS